MGHAAGQLAQGVQLLGLPQHGFQALVLRDVSEYDHHALQLAVRVPNGRRAVGDLSFSPIASDEQGLCDPHHRGGVRQPRDGIGDARPRLLVHDVERLRQRHAHCLFGRPAGELSCDGVEQQHAGGVNV